MCLKRCFFDVSLSLPLFSLTTQLSLGVWECVCVCLYLSVYVCVRVYFSSTNCGHLEKFHCGAPSAGPGWIGRIDFLHWKIFIMHFRYLKQKIFFLPFYWTVTLSVFSIKPLLATELIYFSILKNLIRLSNTIE